MYITSMLGLSSTNTIHLFRLHLTNKSLCDSDNYASIITTKSSTTIWKVSIHGIHFVPVYILQFLFDKSLIKTYMKKDRHEQEMW